ncbi:MAG: LysR family transcriptional regulator [Pseudomonadales bacterium]
MIEHEQGNRGYHSIVGVYGFWYCYPPCLLGLRWGIFVEIHQVRYFLSVCSLRSFTKAADACGVTQPALTVAIRKLESELGDPLFHREGRTIHLSSLGELMQPRFESIMSEMESAQETAKGYRLLDRAPLKVGVMSTIGPNRIGNCLAMYQLRYPGVDLEVHVGTLEQLDRKLQDDELDIAVLSSPKGFDESYRTQLIYTERYLVVFAPNHRFKNQTTINLADVANEHYVDRLACELREVVMGICEQRDITLYANFRSEREDWIQAMVAAGMGFAFMPECSITHQGVLSRPLVDPEVAREVRMVHMPGRKLTPAAKAFMREITAFNWQ